MSQEAKAPSWQACGACGNRLSETDPATVCGCGGLLEVRHPEPPLLGDDLRARFDVRRFSGSSGVWRFAEIVLPNAARAAVSRPEGNTPLVESRAVSSWVGVDDLRLKEEGLNPTGSFKDRGMTVAVTQAVRAGATALSCASTGNTSASLAAYAAQAGVPALVFVPRAKVAAGKLAQALCYGARVLEVRGDFDTCLRLVREASAELGLTLLNSVNPWRIEGQKTIVLEMLQQRGWEPPDWIVVPAGNLGNTAAFGKALVEARDFGLISRLPRLAAIQAAGAAPFYHSFRAGFKRRFRVRAETVATAIRIGDPVSYERAVRSIKQTRGVVAAVSDREILAATAAIDGAGIGCEPASAASLAGLRQLVRRGIVGRRDSVVAVLTGHLLKDPHATRGAPIAIAPRIAEVERVLKGMK